MTGSLFHQNQNPRTESCCLGNLESVKLLTSNSSNSKLLDRVKFIIYIVRTSIHLVVVRLSSITRPNMRNYCNCLFFDEIGISTYCLLCYHVKSHQLIQKLKLLERGNFVIYVLNMTTFIILGN